MKVSVLVLSGSVLSGSALLGGCSSVPTPAPQVAYFVVPCGTPGAIQTGSAPDSAAPHGVSVPATPCIVAAAVPPAHATSRYYPRGYYGGRYFGRPWYGSLGLSFGHHGGGHGGRRHHGGGHGSSGHH